MFGDIRHLMATLEPWIQLFVESRSFNLPPAFGAPIGGDLFEFWGDFWRQKTTVPGLSCGVACVILCLAVLIQYRRVTDRQTYGRTHDDG